MGNIKKIGSFIILIGDPEHEPPHCHIIGGGVDVIVFLDDLSVIGQAKQIREAKKAIKWAEENRDRLMEIWIKMHRA